MSSEDNDEFVEQIKILATDDKKIKSFGEIFSNDSSREILQLLFDEELSATQIAQKTEISLQLVKYHLTKLQDLGVVNISKIEKNSKSQDMKIYTATKFSIVIVPPTLSKKTKESKSLVRSFKYIYKVAGLGIATGVSGLFSLSLSSEQLPVDNTRMELSYDPSQKMMGSTPKDTSTAMSAPMMESESSDLTQRGMDVAETITNSDTFGFELFLPFLILTIVLGGFTVYYFIKSKKSI
ncbi:MAG: winged helix-turn-helix transcriptional regulator [Thaumarchaeota archaeon]|jgi:DNA-binding transcriptional ArsR family regulator|nr:winged helix-turn-helix transcriptional regulator [Nitrososphaerota archaeon]MBT6468909.1 winged helix-turn-helix transcriptional regulator [Nitrososphaerota archaeon]